MNMLDFLQGASNAAASNVSAPVDAIAWLLKKAGIPINNPVMGSDWMAQQGLTREPQNRTAGLLGEAAGLSAPIAVAAKAPQIARGLLGAMDNAAVPRQLNPQTGAVVYHGSPHKFDKFDSSKIGTGEGAQAYGHGLYLADEPKVAREYATPTPGTIKSATRHLYGQSQQGNLYKVDLPDEKIAKMLDWDKPLSQQASLLGGLLSDVQDVGKVAAQKVQQLAQQPGVADWAKRDLMADAAQLAQSKSPQHVAGVLKRMQLEYGISADSGPFKPVAQDFLQFVKGMQAVPNMDTGGGAISYLQARYGEKAASDLLRAQGIPGIKYLDAGSRGAGKGSYNYVVFPGEENTLKILERK